MAKKIQSTEATTGNTPGKRLEYYLRVMSDMMAKNPYHATPGTVQSNYLHSIRCSTKEAIDYAFQLTPIQRRREEVAELKHLTALVTEVRKLFPEMPEEEVHQVVKHLCCRAEQRVPD